MFNILKSSRNWVEFKYSVFPQTHIDSTAVNLSNLELVLDDVEIRFEDW